MNGRDAHASPRLESLALALDAAAHSAECDHVVLAVGATQRGPDSELHLHSLTSGDPAGELVGFVAPVGWDAFGVVVKDLGSRLVYLVGRSGQELFTLRTSDRPTTTPTLSDNPGSGRLADTCRRALDCHSATRRRPGRTLGGIVARPPCRADPQRTWLQSHVAGRCPNAPRRRTRSRRRVPRRTGS